MTYCCCHKISPHSPRFSMATRSRIAIFKLHTYYVFATIVLLSQLTDCVSNNNVPRPSPSSFSGYHILIRNRISTLVYKIIPLRRVKAQNMGDFVSYYCGNFSLVIVSSTMGVYNYSTSKRFSTRKN